MARKENKDWCFWSVLHDVVNNKNTQRIRWTVKCGELELWEEHVDGKRVLCIYYIYVNPDLRRKGVCSDFLSNCEQCTCYDKIVVCAVENVILENILKKRGYSCQGCDWIYER